MPDHKRRRGGHGYNGGGKRQTPRKEPKDLDESSPIIQAFRGFRSELDTRHDKHERLVKLSRDITIESKRTIFLLQRISGASETEATKIYSEAESKIAEVQETKWRDVAIELQNEDPYQFIRAYTAGLQEYVEAVSFWYYLKNNALISWKQIQTDLVFSEKGPNEQAEENNEKESDPSLECSKETTGTKKDEGLPTETPLQNKDSSPGDKEPTEIKNKPALTYPMSVHVPPIDYMLGIADLTGELMRSAINAIGQGQLEEPHRICGFLRCIHEAFVSYGNSSRELNRKLSTLKQSLTKVETACYTLQVRGSEVPKHMLAEVIRSSAENQDFGIEIDGD